MIRMMIEGPGTMLSGFQFWWLKYVNGFDGTQHCARCLRGKYSKAVSRTMPLNTWVELSEYQTPILYLCGVVPGRNYPKNFHLAMEPAPGEITSLPTYNGLSVIVRGARPLPIPPLPDGFGGLSKNFTTCRNFQFGVSHFGY